MTALCGGGGSRLRSLLRLAIAARPRLSEWRAVGGIVLIVPEQRRDTTLGLPAEWAGCWHLLEIPQADVVVRIEGADDAVLRFASDGPGDGPGGGMVAAFRAPLGPGRVTVHGPPGSVAVLTPVSAMRAVWHLLRRHGPLAADRLVQGDASEN